MISVAHGQKIIIYINALSGRVSCMELERGLDAQSGQQQPPAGLGMAALSPPRRCSHLGWPGRR